MIQTAQTLQWRKERQERAVLAVTESEGALARVLAMKLRAKLDPPRAAASGFPYPARTCAEWAFEQ